MSEIREQMKVDLRQAMKVRDSERVTTLRAVLGAIDNAEAVPVETTAALDEPVSGKNSEVPRKLLSAEDIRQIIAHEIAERQQASQTYAALGQSAEAERLQTAAALLTTYL